jgi:2-C-methyl-D-erythritol 2,4-cyclodiphosphate synthase
LGEFSLYRIGFGYDAHPLKEGRKCILCGVDIPGDFGPQGHSDADVPVHALMDALLGALALGDIGNYFPDSDEKWRDADSISLLKLIYSTILKHGYTLSNLDITIVLESPRLSQYIIQMRNRLADALDADSDRISIKATSEEKMGFTGDGSGIKSYAVVLIETMQCFPNRKY